MENLEERLSGLENNNCEVFGFTLDNAEPSQQDWFVILLPQATQLEVLGLTALKPLTSIDDDWLHSQAADYRKEKNISEDTTRVAYFYEKILPQILKILPNLPNLQELLLCNITLSEEDKAKLPQGLKLIDIC